VGPSDRIVLLRASSAADRAGWLEALEHHCGGAQQRQALKEQRAASRADALHERVARARGR
jgi:hypothetical protein